jgi:1-deoxyxylulose-5-phosphate synthase
MEHVRLGSTGLKVSRICLGMMTYGDPAQREWFLDAAAAEPIVRQAVDAGITFFDTADVYSRGVSEEITGHLLGKLFANREDYVLATKVHGVMGDGPNDRGLSRKHILSSIDDSLRRLQTDYVDLYQIHRFDRETPVEETMAALNDVVRAGKARYIGASSMFAWQFAAMQHVAEINGWTKFVSMQDHYNLIYREEEREMLPLCVDQGVGVIPWSPLGRGWLTRPRMESVDGPTARSRSDAFARGLYEASDGDVVDRVQEVAAQREVPMARVALAWILSRPAVTAPIIGASKAHHVDDAVGALDIHLTEDEIARLEEPYRPHPIRGHS